MSNHVDGPKLARQAVSERSVATVEAFKRAMADHLYYTRGQAAYTASLNDVYMALAYTVRDYLMGRWQKTVDAYFEAGPKFVYYLSAEYLMGQQLAQNLLYTGTTEVARQALAEYGFDLDQIMALDAEPGLGNGGLGRLAACFLDSLATLDIPAAGYGIRYEFGIFKQSFKDGWQVESPDEWLYYGNPWEFTQPDDMVEVKFGGYTEHYTDEAGRFRVRWVHAQTVLGEPCHTLVPGYKTGSVNMLRLWRARASKEFDFQLFDVGDYARAVEQKTYSENITKVLYPNDNTPQGRALRLRQQYFFVSCSLQNIVNLFLTFNQGWQQFPEKAVIQLNDTHPTIAVAELMRLMLDEHGLSWGEAWDITQRVFAYTVHTLLPEALEKWPVSLFEQLLPRHLEIIYEINRRFLDEVAQRFPNDPERLRRMSIVEEGAEKQVRMAHLAAVGSFSINGVAELQTELLKERVLHDFYELWPAKFNNKTNGVTPRRFVRLANPRLAKLITSKIGEEWLVDPQQLERLEAYAKQASFCRTWRSIKRQNKVDLAAVILERTGVRVEADSLFDVMVKRLHEYKRQLLKALHIVTLYNRLKADPDQDIVPRTFIFGAKAAPGYQAAKLIIKLINSIAEVVNGDPDVRGRLKVVFLPNFNVTLGEKIYPAADLSEQISMAGKEASGTGNMKFALNGALTVGTLDGANIEIRQLVGEENFFLFGLTAAEAAALKENGYRPSEYYHRYPELKQAIGRIASGHFSNGDAELFQPVVDSLLLHDEYLVLADYPSYIERQDEAALAYRDQAAWTHKSILNTARCGFFSSDRAIQQYCQDIWKAKPLKVALE
ncbi:MAG: glycogen/starch/alpha-glucan phosphorylase [Thermoflexales bacterium]|nr:glycogen/starch/alpha-glucan phosphorylase [Thermoflexales bacterium]